MKDLLIAVTRTDAAVGATRIAAHRAGLREAASRLIPQTAGDDTSPLAAARAATAQLAAEEEKRLKALPSTLRAPAREAAAPLHEAHGLRVAQRLQNLRVADLTQEAEATLALLQRQAVREPQAAAGYLEEGGRLLRSLQAAGALTEEAAGERRRAFRQSLYTEVLRGLPAREAVARLEQGHYDARLDDAALRERLLTESRWRLHSEREQGAALTEELVAWARRGETPSAALLEGADRLLDDAGLAQAEQRIGVAERVREELATLRFAPEAALRAAASRSAFAVEARLQSETMLQQRRRDPAGHAMGLPSVAAAFAAAAQEPELLPAAISLRLAAQAAMGLAPSERRVLSAAELEELQVGPAGPEGTGRAAALQALAARHGEAGETAAEEAKE